MIDSSLWEILVTFQECGTLSAAAEKLYVSQPSLSAAMKRLEKELGVTLFERSKNRIELNEVGEEAVRLARMHIQSERNMVEQLQEMARRLSAITVASYATGLCRMLAEKLSGMFPEKSIVSEHLPSELLPGGLSDGRFDFAITEYPIDEPELECVPYMTDRLMVRLSASDVLAGRESVTLQDLQGSTLLVWTQTGFWASHIRKKLSDKLHLVFVNDEKEYHELLQAFDMRAFILESFVANSNLQSTYHCVPLAEEGMNVSFYLCCPLKNQSLLPALLPHPLHN